MSSEATAQTSGVPVLLVDVRAESSLQTTLREAMESSLVRCIVLAAGSDPAASDVEPSWMPAQAKPIIFAFDREVAGAELGLALGADIRLGGPNAAFDIPAVAGGWVADRLLRLAGARLPGIRGRVVPAMELLDSGLVSALPGDPVAEALRLGTVIASRGPIAEELAKEAVWRGLELPLAQALRLETDLTLLLQTTKDRAEGVRAFLEKREPVFRGV